MHQRRNHSEGGVFQFMSINILISKWEQTWFNFKVRTSLSANGRDIELFSTELLFDKRCHALPWYQYHKNHEEN